MVITHSTSSDVELAALLKKGDRSAYTEIYNRYWLLLFRHARKMLQDEDEAIDAVQDVFTMLWTKAGILDVNVSLSSFLYTSVRNNILNLIKRSKIRDRYLDSIEAFLDKGEFVTDNEIRYKEFSATIETEISKLPPKMRQVFEMSRKLGLSYSQIAAELQISDETVRKQMYRALKQLRAKLDPHLFSLIFL